MTNRIGTFSKAPQGNGAQSAPVSGRPRETTHLRELYNFVLRNRALVLGVPVVVIVATLVFVYLVTPVYDANAWLRIDEQRSNLAVLDALQTLSSGEQIHTEMAVLRRRPLAEEVVDSLALQLVVEEPARVPRSALLADASVEDDVAPASYLLERADNGFRVTREDTGEELGGAVAGGLVTLNGASFRLLPAALGQDEIRLALLPMHEAVADFRRTLEVSRPDRDADLIRLRYQATDSILVRDVPNTTARYFIRNRQSVRKTEARSTVQFLNEQIALLSTQLRQSENDLRRFREAENIVSLEAEGEVKVSRYAQMKAERDLLNTERQALAQMRADANARAESPRDPLAPSPFRDLIAFPTLFANFSVGELFRSMAEVENQRAEMLTLRRPEDPDVQVLTSRIHELERQLQNIAGSYLEGLTQQVGYLDETLERFRTELGEVPAKEVQYARLFRQTEVLDEIYTQLQTRLKEAEIAAAVEDPSVRVVEPAVIPTEPIRPNKPLSLILALLLGVALGAGAAFLRENLDASIHTREDLQEVAPGVPVLGLIPRIREAAVNGGRSPAPTYSTRGVEDLSHRLIAGRDPRSPISEAYRSMRTNIAFSGLERTHRLLVFTSALPADGKSTSAANLAITLVQQNHRCLLVDADMRRGVLNELFDEVRSPGLSDVIVGEAELDDAVRTVDLGESGRLDFLPSGTFPPNPAELISSDRCRDLLERLQSSWDTVILDAPPLNLVTDAALLGSAADGVVVVARSGVTDRGAVSYALEQLVAVRAPLLGVVLNDIDVRKDRYYGSYGLAGYERYAAEVGDPVKS